MLIREGEQGRSPSPSRSMWTLPPEMVDASIRRVGMIAPLYAATYFMAAFIPNLLTTTFPTSRSTAINFAYLGASPCRGGFLDPLPLPTPVGVILEFHFLL